VKKKHDHGHHHHGSADDAHRGSVDPARIFPRRRSKNLETHREPLSEGAGKGKVLFLDTFSGIAGDMTIAALVDLGVPFEVVERAVGALSLPGVSARLERAEAGSIGALRFDVEVKKSQPHRHYADIDALIAGAKLSSATKNLARSIFRTLGRAEAAVHRIPIDDVHFHEVGAADAIVDIVGASACFSHLGAEVVCAPLPLGRGFVKSAHGPLPLPAPATVACLRGAPTYDPGISAELVTPTGAAIVAQVARSFSEWPSFAPLAVGWGAGTMKLPDRPNALRVVLGVPERRQSESATDTHVVLEANVDDMTGELAGHAIAELIDQGALDAWAVPVTMKKGRPGLVLSALAKKADASRLAETLLRETSSIGVRYAPVSRVERPRTVRTVTTEFGKIPVKVSSGPFDAPIVKPEFEACRKAAQKHKVPVRVVIEAAMRAASGAE
jgi:pyridinium-3,5-bisthiocarboxylic acid mononucleotide nickel chelatase